MDKEIILNTISSLKSAALGLKWTKTDTYVTSGVVALSFGLSALQYNIWSSDKQHKVETFIQSSQRLIDTVYQQLCIDRNPNTDGAIIQMIYPKLSENKKGAKKIATSDNVSKLLSILVTLEIFASQLELSEQEYSDRYFIYFGGSLQNDCIDLISLILINMPEDEPILYSQILSASILPQLTPTFSAALATALAKLAISNKKRCAEMAKMGLMSYFQVFIEMEATNEFNLIRYAQYKLAKYVNPADLSPQQQQLYAKYKTLSGSLATLVSFETYDTLVPNIIKYSILLGYGLGVRRSPRDALTLVALNYSLDTFLTKLDGLHKYFNTRTGQFLFSSIVGSLNFGLLFRFPKYDLMAVLGANISNFIYSYFASQRQINSYAAGPLYQGYMGGVSLFPTREQELSEEEQKHAQISEINDDEDELDHA